MADVGITFRVDAQTDGLKQSAADFKAFQDQISSVLGITDPEVAEAYWEEYNSGLEKATKFADSLSMIQQRNLKNKEKEEGEAIGTRTGSSKAEEDTVKPIGWITRAQSTLTGLVRGGSRDAIGTGLNTAESLLGAAAGTPAISAAAGAAITAGMAALGAGIVGNELSKTYEAVAPALMEATAALREFGSTGKEQSANFQLLMNDMSKSVSKYGYTVEQGLSLVTQVARGGAKAGEEKTIVDDVMRISRNIGLASPASELTELATLGSRFRQKDALEYAVGGANRVVGSPRLLEQASALSSMFEDVLGQGIEASFKELSSTQNWLYRVFGERAVGQSGASIFSGLSSAVRGSTSLSNETDILKYQAARDLTGGDQLTALMKLEEGFSQELFEQFQEKISGASKWDKVFLTSKAFGVSLTTASQLVDAPQRAEEVYKSTTAGSGEAMADTSIVKLYGAQESIANQIRNLGAPLSDIKSAVINKSDEIVAAVLGNEEKLNEKVKFNLNFGTMEKQSWWQPFGAGLSGALSGGWNVVGDALSGNSESETAKNSSWASIHTLFNANKGKLSQLPEREVKKINDLEMADNQPGWSNKELKAVISVLEKIAKHTGDMSKMELTVTPEMFNQ